MYVYKKRMIVQKMHISPEDPHEPISSKFGIACHFIDLMTHDSFLAVGLGVLNLWGVELCHFSICRRSPLTPCWRYRAASDTSSRFWVCINRTVTALMYCSYCVDVAWQYWVVSVNLWASAGVLEDTVDDHAPPGWRTSPTIWPLLTCGCWRQNITERIFL